MSSNIWKNFIGEDGKLIIASPRNVTFDLVVVPKNPSGEDDDLGMDDEVQAVTDCLNDNLEVYIFSDDFDDVDDDNDIFDEDEDEDEGDV
jgi:hypothetical protein